MSEEIKKPAGGWITFLLQVAIAVLLVNVLFDAINVFSGYNLKKYFNKPISTFYPGQAGTSSQAASASSGS